jgi:hypothetical protein
MSTAILNYTTKVPAGRTVSEIITLLARKGAGEVSQKFDQRGRVTAIEFSLQIAGTVWFRMPANIEGVHGHMLRNAPPRFRNREQAERVAWRILKDWTEAQLALVESQQGEMAQVFFPYAVGDDGRTAYQHFVDNRKQLGAGSQ